MSIDDENDAMVSAIANRLREDIILASQEDAAVVAAMARQANDDADLIDGAVLTEREARALWTLQALGCGREES